MSVCHLHASCDGRAQMRRCGLVTIMRYSRYVSIICTVDQARGSYSWCDNFMSQVNTSWMNHIVSYTPQFLVTAVSPSMACVLKSHMRPQCECLTSFTYLPTKYTVSATHIPKLPQNTQDTLSKCQQRQLLLCIATCFYQRRCLTCHTYRHVQRRLQIQYVMPSWLHSRITLNK